MNQKSRKHFVAIFAFMVLLCSSCRSHNEFLWQIGCYLFIGYFILLLTTIMLPKIHRLRWFQSLIEEVKTPASYLAGFILLGGIFIIGVGCSKWADDFGPGRLTLLLGAIVLTGGANLLLWARSNSPEEKALRLKIVLMSTAFAIGIANIMCGSQLLG